MTAAAAASRHPARIAIFRNKMNQIHPIFGISKK